MIFEMLLVGDDLVTRCCIAIDRSSFSARIVTYFTIRVDVSWYVYSAIFHR